MAEMLAAQCRKDSEARVSVQKELAEKLGYLKQFREAMQEVPQVLRRFLLLRSSSIEGDLQELKAWVTHEEADAAHKQLEEFRDEASEEKVLRRLKDMSSDDNIHCTAEPPPGPMAMVISLIVERVPFVRLRSNSDSCNDRSLSSPRPAQG